MTDRAEGAYISKDNQMPPPRGGADRRRRLRPCFFNSDSPELVYVSCSCGGRIQEPFFVADSIYSVAKTHRRSRGTRTCRVLVTIYPDGCTAVERVPDDTSFEMALIDRSEAA